MKGIVDKIYDLGISLRAFCKEANVNIVTLKRASDGHYKTRRDIAARIMNTYERLKNGKA